MRQTGYPELAPVADMGPEGYIAALYKGLGWDGESTLDPTKITINQQRWLDVCKEFVELSSSPAQGFIWVNSGPSADADVPYNAVRIEPGAFKELSAETTLEEDRDSVDKAVQSLYMVRDGNVIQLDADTTANNSLLLEKAHDCRHMAPEDFTRAMHASIAEDWAEAVDLNADYVLREAGIRPHDTERYEAARDYLFDNYEIRPPYEELMGQEVDVNILLGTPEEKDLDFSSLHDMRLDLAETGAVSQEAPDNALTWLVGQQGYTYGELQDAASHYGKWGFDAAEITSGTFLASVANELSNFPNIMGTIAVLARIPLEDIPKLSAPGNQITVPENATVGIFAPWVGGGSMLGIQLDRPLAIPTEMIFETQFESANSRAFTVLQVYGLGQEAWKRPLGIEARDLDRERPLDDLMREAKEKAQGKNIGRIRAPRVQHRDREQGR